MADERPPKISVIAPVYGVENFIERAAESMMNQTLEDVEFIFIDDCTTDKSIDILRRIIARYPHRNVRIIRHYENRGLPAARNTGLDVAKGEYIFHWDSDDFAEPDMLESLYREAVAKVCDYIWCDWFLTFNTNCRTMVQPNASTPREALSLVLSGSMKYNVWNKLISRRLYEDNRIRFPERRAMGEDMTMIKLLVMAARVGHVRKPFYHYIRTNSGAMTQIYSPKHLTELQDNTSDLCLFIHSRIKDDTISKEINWFKLNVKLPFLFSGRKDDMKLWRKWYPEANKDIISNHRQALRTRVLQWTAAHRLGFINTVYNNLVFKFIYGIIYR